MDDNRVTRGMQFCSPKTESLCSTVVCHLTKLHAGMGVLTKPPQKLTKKDTVLFTGEKVVQRRVVQN